MLYGTQFGSEPSSTERQTGWPKVALSGSVSRTTSIARALRSRTKRFSVRPAKFPFEYCALAS